MRIAIATDWFPPRQGGIENQLSQMSARLAARGHIVDVLTSTPHATDADGYHIRSFAEHTIPRLDLALSPRLLESLRVALSRDYDVVHAHISVVSPLGYAALAIAQSLGLPTVATFHSVLRSKRFLLRAADTVARIASRPVIWTGVSELVASQLRKALPRADVGVLSNGVDLSSWGARTPATTDDAKRPVTFVTATRLHRKKRPAQLIAAFTAAAATANVPVTLVLAGEGPERSAIERDLRERGLGLGPVRVELLGWQSASELRALYARADVFVLASIRESFGIAALEAAVAGLPVVAMHDSGCREFIGAADGYLCEDDAELTRVLGRLMAAPPPRLAADGRFSRYDWSTVIAAHEAAYARATERAAAALLPA